MEHGTRSEILFCYPICKVSILRLRNTMVITNALLQAYYNADLIGMGNRFRNMAGYSTIIIGHGTVAAITFLFILPAAIFMARFYHRNPRMALRIHIWLQIMVVLLSTAVFVLGFQAVGSKRSLTNPHHGIGVALYAMILVQAFAGCIIHRSEKGKERFKVPLKLMVCDPPFQKKSYNSL